LRAEWKKRRRRRERGKGGHVVLVLRLLVVLELLGAIQSWTCMYEAGYKTRECGERREGKKRLWPFGDRRRHPSYILYMLTVY